MSGDAAISVESVVEQTKTVYSLPFFYERLNETINHPRSSIADIAKIMTEDQGLTARILKLANSPMFGYYSKVDSISKALTIIGTQQLRDLALAGSVIKLFRGIPEELISMASFWQHSIACGIVARCLAAYLRESNVERFFVAGILHDVGQLAMCTTIPETVRDIFETSRKTEKLYHVAEYEWLGFDHSEVGGALFRAWKIPSSIIEPVACHHAPCRAATFPLEAAVIHLSDIICQGIGFGHSAEWFVCSLDENAWNRLGMPVSVLSTVLKQAEPQIEETFSILTEDQ
ncbi:HDOD domain-containing protein [Geobacter sp. DSM 9736]|uniref:HDOD domain-containing protein n=1 Tax=Geobacter sp. DSM 9736 TaxID=1277350 RepID=UPI000B5067CA|nr:HDOD domain-containing protein [Geobacter sp. DSM 9736]SNB45136.1 HD-like signal output (HDOD) domain, no enzymatic activity [Geobacter sp. DSM 9736]